MKRIVAIMLVVLVAQGTMMAQKGRSVNVNDVPERYVQNLRNQAQDAQNVSWTMIDSLVYDATYTNAQGTKVIYRFSNKGTETRWQVNSKWYPNAIKDTVATHYPSYKIDELYVLSIRGKMTYQAIIIKRGGLFFRKNKSTKLLNFETSGKFIDEIEIKRP